MKGIGKKLLATLSIMQTSVSAVKQVPLSKDVIQSQSAYYQTQEKSSSGVHSQISKELEEEEINLSKGEINKFIKEGYLEEEIKKAIEVIQNEVKGIQNSDYSGRYVEEETVQGIANAIQNYMDDERELNADIEAIKKENHPRFKERRIERAKEARKYKRDRAYWDELEKENKRMRQELVKGDSY